MVGNTHEPEIVPHPKGTTIIIEKLFFQNEKKNEILKKSNRFIKELENIIYCYAIHLSHISIKFSVNCKIFIDTTVIKSKPEIIQRSFREIEGGKIFEVHEQLDSCNMFLNIIYTRPNDASSLKKFVLFINNRCVDYDVFAKTVKNAYENCSLAINKSLHSYFCFVEIKINPILLDFNLTADKRKVKLIKEKEIADFLYNFLLSELKKVMNIKSYQALNVGNNELNRRISLNGQKSEENGKFFVRSDPKTTTLDLFVARKSQQPVNESVNILSQTIHKTYKKVSSQYMDDEFINDYSAKRIKTEIQAETEEDIFYSDKEVNIDAEPTENDDSYIPTTNTGAAMKIITNDKTPVLLMESEYIGATSPFNILIQHSNLLIKVEMMSIVQTYFLNCLQAYFQDINQEDFNLIELDFKCPTFDEILDNIDCENKEELRKNNTFSDFVSRINFLPFCELDINNSLIKVLLFPDFTQMLNTKCLYQLIFQLYMHFTNRNLNMDLIFTKFYLFILYTTAEIDFFNYKPAVDNFYRKIFDCIKKKRLTHDFTDLDERTQILMDIKSAYKLFERC